MSSLIFETAVELLDAVLIAVGACTVAEAIINRLETLYLKRQGRYAKFTLKDGATVTLKTSTPQVLHEMMEKNGWQKYE